MATKRGARLPTGDEVTLTPRQREVIELMAKGKTNAKIGDALGIRLDGAKWHVSEILSVLGVDTREQAVEVWREQARLDRRVGRAVRAISPTAGLKLVGTGAAAALVAGTALGVWILLANGGGDPGTSPGVSPSADVATPPVPQATATWTPFIVGTATPRVEPGAANHEALRSANLVVYADQFSDELWASGMHEIVVYDLDSGRPAASFRVSNPISMELVGRSVLIQDSTTVTLSGLTGTPQVVFEAPPDRIITGFAVSNDGALVAIGTEGADSFPDERSELLVVELATGDVTRTFTFDELGVTPVPLAWRADGSAIEFRQWLHKGVIDMAGTGTARLDGSVEHHEGSLVEIDREGRVGAWSTGDISYGCDAVNEARDRYELRDLSTGDRLGELTLPDHVLKDGVWSPDGREFLVAAHAVDSQLPNGQPCWDWPAPKYYLWNDSGFEHVADHHAVLRRWEGDRYVEVDCDGNLLTRWTGQPLPQVTCIPSLVSPRANIRIDGEVIDSVRNATIIGFIDAL